MIYPVDMRWASISQYFDEHPPIKGIDIAPNWSWEYIVHAIEEGWIMKVSFQKKGLGKYIVINHKGGYSSYYGHLKDTFVIPTNYVKLGQPIGIMGSTGLASGRHLHLTLKQYGEVVDPVPLMTTEFNFYV